MSDPTVEVMCAWDTVWAFTQHAGLCYCNGLDDAITELHTHLTHYPDLAGATWKPPPPNGWLIAYAMEGWDLISHGGSVQTGNFREKKGTILLAALDTLAAAGLDLVPPWFRDSIWTEPEGYENWWDLADPTVFRAGRDNPQ